MTRDRIPVLLFDRDRHGNERVYVRRHGRKIRIRAKPGRQEFAEAYAEALKILAQGHVAATSGAQRRTRGHASAGWQRVLRLRRTPPS